MAANLLEVDGLVKRFGPTVALQSVSASIHAGCASRSSAWSFTFT